MFSPIWREANQLSAQPAASDDSHSSTPVNAAKISVGPAPPPRGVVRPGIFPKPIMIAEGF